MTLVNRTFSTSRTGSKVDRVFSTFCPCESAREVYWPEVCSAPPSFGQIANFALIAEINAPLELGRRLNFALLGLNCQLPVGIVVNGKQVISQLIGA